VSAPEFYYCDGSIISRVDRAPTADDTLRAAAQAALEALLVALGYELRGGEPAERIHRLEQERDELLVRVRKAEDAAAQLRKQSDALQTEMAKDMEERWPALQQRLDAKLRDEIERTQGLFQAAIQRNGGLERELEEKQNSLDAAVKEVLALQRHLLHLRRLLKASRRENKGLQESLELEKTRRAAAKPINTDEALRVRLAQVTELSERQAHDITLMRAKLARLEPVEVTKIATELQDFVAWTEKELGDIDMEGGAIASLGRRSE